MVDLFTEHASVGMHTEEKRLRGDIWGLKQRSKDSGSISVTCPYMKFVLIKLFTFLLSSGKLVLECIWNKYAALKTSWSVSAEGLSVFLMLGDRCRWRLRTSPHPPRLTYPRSGLWQIQCLLGSLPGSLAIFLYLHLAERTVLQSGSWRAPLTGFHLLDS